MTKGRSLPAIAGHAFRENMSKHTKNNPTSPKGTVGYFSGCNNDFVFPDTSDNVVKVLQDLNYAVVYPMEQSCCGKPIMGVGDRDAGRTAAKRNIEAFEKLNVDVILAACPTCTETLHSSYMELLKDDPEWSKRAEAFCHKVREFTSFVYEEYEKEGRIHGERLSDEKMTYHDSCHMKRGLGVHDEPRKLIESAAGVEYVEMEKPDKCCGMAGSFGIKYENISKNLLEEKVQNIKATGAGTCVVACPACMMQIGGGLDSHKTGIKVKHIADVLAERLDKK